jgi:hypothetical protein
MDNVDARIAKKLVASVDKVEHGTEPLRPQPVGPGQIESSVHFSTWKDTEEKPKGVQPADQITMADTREVDPSEVVTVGNVTLAPSGLSGFERAFTRFATDYLVTVDDQPVRGDAALHALYTALLSEKKAK